MESGPFSRLARNSMNGFLVSGRRKVFASPVVLVMFRCRVAKSALAKFLVASHKETFVAFRVALRRQLRTPTPKNTTSAFAKNATGNSF